MTYGTTNWPRLCKVLPKRTWSLLHHSWWHRLRNLGECAHCPLSHWVPITRVLRHLSGAVLFCHYHCTVYKSKTHFSYFFLIFVYSGITPNTTNSFSLALARKKKAKIHTKMASSTPEPPPNNPKIFFQTALSFGTRAANKSWTIMMEAKQVLLLCLS